MATPKKTPQKGIDYIHQFPKYFVIPYGEVRPPTEENFVARISENNTEIFTRPKVHISESASTILDNLNVFDNQLLSETYGPRTKRRLTELAELAPRLDSRTSAETTEEDVKRFVAIVKSDRTNDLAHYLFDTGHKLFSIGIHLMTNHFLFKHPDFVAERMNLKSRNDSAFKESPSEETFLQMLTQEMVAPSQRLVRAQSVRKSLASVLDSSDDELPSPPPKRKKKNKKSLPKV